MIKPEELDHLADLARIELDENDKKSLVKDFDSILAYVDQLKEVKVSTAAEERIGAVRNVLREDKAEPVSEEERKLLLDNIPDKEGEFVAVKKIIEQD